jgi:hypothetical protein
MNNQLCFIATPNGFVEGTLCLNGKYRLQTTRDMREAMPFATFNEAEHWLKAKGGTFWNFSRQHFCIVVPAAPEPHVPDNLAAQ